VLAAAGAVAVWFSHPAVFVLAGAGTTLLVAEARRGRPIPAAGVSLCWAVSFLVSYVAVVRHLNANTFLNQFWGADFLRFPPSSPDDLRQYLAVFLELFETIFQDHRMPPLLGERMAVLAAVVWAVGVVALLRRGERGLLALLVLPLGFAAAASMMHKYPLRYRLALFTVGPNLLLMAAGIAEALRAPDGLTRSIGRIFVVGLGLLPALQAAQGALERTRPYGARPVLARVAQRWRPGDLILADPTSEPPLRFYRDFGRVAGLDRLVPTVVSTRLRNPEQLAREVARLRDAAGSGCSSPTTSTSGRRRRGPFIALTLDRAGPSARRDRGAGLLRLPVRFRRGGGRTAPQRSGLRTRPLRSFG
jgi:hypothetical protein